MPIDECNPCGPSKCEGYYHGDDSDPDICDAYEASEIRIEYHPTYFVSEPTKRRSGSATVLFDRVKVDKIGRVTRKTDAIEFKGDTTDEMDRQLVEWVEANGATEKTT